MQPCRLHITGASGAGTTTLARSLANVWSVPCHDTDDYFWLPTNPPFTAKRPVAERLDLMQSMFIPRDAWVLSGSLSGWGNPLITEFDAVVFLYLEPTVRMRRLEQREISRYGQLRLGSGGDLNDNFVAFMQWARGYDDPDFDGRSLSKHNTWLSKLPCPVIRFNSDQAPDELLASVLAA